MKMKKKKKKGKKGKNEKKKEDKIYAKNWEGVVKKKRAYREV